MIASDYYHNIEYHGKSKFDNFGISDKHFTCYHMQGKESKVGGKFI